MSDRTAAVVPIGRGHEIRQRRAADLLMAEVDRYIDQNGILAAPGSRCRLQELEARLEELDADGCMAALILSRLHERGLVAQREPEHPTPGGSPCLRLV